MSDDSGKSFFSSIPLPGLVAVITGVMGTILLHYEPLPSRRPADPPKINPVASESYLIDATLYEDPLSVIARTTFRKPKPKSEAQPGAKPEAQPVETQDDTDTNPRALHDPESLRSEVTKKTNSGSASKRPIVMPIFMRSGSDAVSSESRSRMRLAVIEGLASCAYVPESNKLQCCRFPKGGSAGKTYLPGELDVPFEWFKLSANMPSLIDGKDAAPPYVLVLWLRWDVLKEAPVTRLRWILSEALPREKDSSPNFWSIFAWILRETFPREKDSPTWSNDVRVKVLGPPSTDDLAKVVKEASEWEMPEGVWPHKIEMYSHAATASDQAVLDAAAVSSDDLDEVVQKALLGEGQTSSEDKPLFRRTITTDDHVSQALVSELRLRGLDLRRLDESGSTSHVAIISEFDTSYGRALPTAILQAADPESKADKFNTKGSHWHWLTFPRGLDGRSAGGSTPAPAAPGKSAEGEKDKNYRPDEVPDGPNQADGLRRLAEQLEELDKRLIFESKSKKDGHLSSSRAEGIRAIGLMGADVYDKLWLLRALKPRFQNTIFFTDNLDAWLWQRDELRSTRNLVIASPYGLSLSSRLQMGKAPFRDSYQTATYAATLAALGGVDGAWLKSAAERDVRLYEIGTGGPHDLSNLPTDHDPGQGEVYIHPVPVEPWWDGIKVYGITLGSIGIIVLIAAVGAIPRIACTASSARSWGRKLWEAVLAVGTQYLRNWVMWLPVLIVVPFMVVYQLWQNQRVIGEPFFLWEGISGWPTLAIRIAAILLAFHLALLLFLRLRDNAWKLQKKFFPGMGHGAWETAGGQIFLWNTSALEGKVVSPAKLWREYVVYSRWTKRCARASIIFVVLSIALLLVEKLSGSVSSPIRGEHARAWDTWLDWISAGALLALVALVIDAMWTSRMFVHLVTRGQTRWPDSLTRIYQKGWIGKNAACDYLDLLLVAERTRPVASLAFYPFYVVALLVVSRFNGFDHWAWRKGVILGFLIAFLAIVIAVRLLRGDAENIRSKLIDDLKDAEPAFPRNERSPGNQLAKEVQTLKAGAFAPFSEQPVMKGVYWLVSGLGITQLWQYLAHVF